MRCNILLFTNSILLLLWLFPAVVTANNVEERICHLARNYVFESHDSILVTLQKGHQSFPAKAELQELEKVSRGGGGNLVCRTRFRDGEKIRVILKVRTFDTCWVARKRIPPRTLLTPALVERRLVETTRLSYALTGATDSVLGLYTRRVVPAGQPLRNDLLQVPRKVHNGDLVRLVVACGNIRVTDQARALRDGAVGDRVPVRTLTTGKVLTGVIDPRGEVILNTP